jgi:micrococcal nuclease
MRGGNCVLREDVRIVGSCRDKRVALVIAVLAALVLLGCGSLGESSRTPITATPTETSTFIPSPTSQPTSTAIPPRTGTLGPTATSTPTLKYTPAPGAVTARVVNIVDGDTIDVEIEGKTYRVRYIGMDTPERGRPFFSEATEANRQLVEGKTVIVEKDVSDTDRYGRLLLYVYLQDGTFVNAELVRLGYAQVATYPPDVKHQELFVQLQQEAREAGRGLWAEPTPASIATPVQAQQAVCDCSGNKYNRSHFATHAQAQACYEYCMSIGRGDVHRLDGDSDGSACESLP